MSKDLPQKESKDEELEGFYIPPFKKNQKITEILEKNDKKSEEYQKVMWELLQKSINGIINKVNISNIQNITIELFHENLFKGKGLLVNSIMKAQISSPNFTSVYAALISIINSKIPDIGSLTIRRYIMSFRRSFKKNSKIQLFSTTKMIAHLINQQVNDSVLAFGILIILIEFISDDSIEVICNFLMECGQFLSENNPKETNKIFDNLRKVLEEGKVSKRVQYSIEKLFEMRKKNFEEFPSVIKELDLVPDEDKIIHQYFINEEINEENDLNKFKYDENYEQNEKIWEEIKREILGDENDENQVNNFTENLNKEITELAKKNIENENNITENNESEEDENENNQIVNFNNVDLIKLRKNIYLTIISTLDFQECVHKLLKLQIKEGQEIEIVNMIIECCIQERTYLRFHGLLSERLCKLKDSYKKNYENEFYEQYTKLHRLDINKIRNLSKLYAHLLYTFAIDWKILSIIKLTVEDTTASSRIFIKFLFQEMAEDMGLEKLNDQLQERALDDYSGIFCRDNPKNTIFAINFFTSIGLGALTDELREFRENAEKFIKDKEEENNNNLIKDKSDSEDTVKIDEEDKGNKNISRDNSKQSISQHSFKESYKRKNDRKFRSHRRKSRSRSIKNRSRSRSRNKREKNRKYK